MTDVPEMVERSARAAYERFNEGLIGCCEDPWDKLPEDFRQRMCEAQRAAIEAMREPTQDMLTARMTRTPALVTAESIDDLELLLQDWQGMIDAALGKGQPETLSSVLGDALRKAGSGNE